METMSRHGWGSGMFARSAIAVVVAGSFSSGSALAQQPAETAAADTLVVTGSRIKRQDLDSASPVTVIGREEILATGVRDVGELLQRLPSMSGSPIGTTTNNGGDGSVQVDLRGLGANRTLTLVNGKRTVDGGDFQTIPAAMIERVEILKDGGSSIYGADAVAGVVNIITRTDYDGVSFDVQRNSWDKTRGADQTSVSLVAGKSFTGGHFVFGAEYVKQKEAYQADAPWDFFQNSYYIYPEGCERQPAAPYDGTPTGGCYPLGSGSTEEGRYTFIGQPSDGAGGRWMNLGSGLVPDDNRTYNFAPVNYIQTPYERLNLFAEGAYDITDAVRFSASVRANKRESAQELAPTPYDSNFDPAFQGIFDSDGDGIPDTAYNGVHPDNFYLANATAAAGLEATPTERFRRRMSEQPRRFTQDVNQYQASFGFNGTLADAVDWDIYYNNGLRDQISRDFGQYTGARLQNALGPSADLDGDGVPECYGDINNPASLIQGCVPLNLFGGPGTVTPEMLRYVSAILVDTVKQTQEEAGLSFTGFAMDLPGGKLGWALGYQYRAETLTFTPDSGKQTSAVTGNKSSPTEGSIYANAFFGEIQAPVFNNGEQSLNLKASLRTDDFSGIGNETTWGLGFEANALRSVKLRATAGTVYRAPTITDLFGGLFDSFPTFSDPCLPDPNSGAVLPTCPGPAPQEPQLLSRSGGNPDLRPESGDTLTAGIVLTPSLPFGKASLTVDYWKIEFEDGISSLGVQFILNDCYVNGNAASCALVTRRADFGIQQVIDASLNVAEQTAAGIDTELRYTFSPGSGEIDVAVLWTHLIERTKVPFPGSEEDDLAGRSTDVTAADGGTYAKDKINYSINWSLNSAFGGRGDFSVGYLGEFISSVDADTFCNCGPGAAASPDGKYIQKIGSQLYHDLAATYTFNWDSRLPGRTRLAAGITNFTNEEPPFIEIGFNATTDPSTYRMFGRGYYFRLSQEF
jgi:iron complex outermembrane recepter protein